MILWLIGFLTEILLFWIWYELIYNRSNKTFFWLTRKSLLLLFTMLELITQNSNDTENKTRTANSRKALNTLLSPNVLLLFASALIFPLAVLLLIHAADFLANGILRLLAQAILCISGIACVLDFFIKYRVPLGNYLDSYIRFLHEFTTDTLSPEYDTTDTDTNVIDDNAFFEFHIKDMGQMCQELHLPVIPVISANLSTQTALTGYDKDYGPYILISSGKYQEILHQFGEIECMQILKMITAHELVHIAYKDYNERRIVWKTVFCYLLLGLIMFTYVLNAWKFMSETMYIFIFLVLGAFSVFAGTVIMNQKYWKQVMELRADRIGMKISQTSAEQFVRLMQFIPPNDTVKNNFIYQYYQKYILEDSHPSAQRRISEIRRGKPWSVHEYFRYLLLTGIHVFSLKGWNL